MEAQKGIDDKRSTLREVLYHEKRHRCADCNRLTYDWERIGKRYNCWICGKERRQAMYPSVYGIAK